MLVSRQVVQLRVSADLVLCRLSLEQLRLFSVDHPRQRIDRHVPAGHLPLTGLLGHQGAVQVR